MNLGLVTTDICWHIQYTEHASAAHVQKPTKEFLVTLSQWINTSWLGCKLMHSIISCSQNVSVGFSIAHDKKMQAVLLAAPNCTDWQTRGILSTCMQDSLY